MNRTQPHLLKENYAKVAVLCSRCGELLAVYRKRNARKSQLVLSWAPQSQGLTNMDFETRLTAGRGRVLSWFQHVSSKWFVVVMDWMTMGDIAVHDKNVWGENVCRAHSRGHPFTAGCWQSKRISWWKWRWLAESQWFNSFCKEWLCRTCMGALVCFHMLSCIMLNDFEWCLLLFQSPRQQQSWTWLAW